MLSVTTLGLPAQLSYYDALDNCQTEGFLEWQDCMTGNRMLPFEAATYQRKKIRPEDLKGTVYVLNFWFISCPPCIAELDGFNEIVEQYEGRKDIRFLAITFNEPDLLEEEFFPNYTFKFEIIPDAKELIFEDFRIRSGFPTTFLVDRNGIIRKVFSGGSTDEATASAEVKELLIPEIEKCLKPEGITNGRR